MMNPDAVTDKEPELDAEGKIQVMFIDLLEALATAKPNDRSPIDRRYAVLITEVEKVMSYHFTMIMNRFAVDEER